VLNAKGLKCVNTNIIETLVNNAKVNVYACTGIINLIAKNVEGLRIAFTDGKNTDARSDKDLGFVFIITISTLVKSVTATRFANTM